MSSAAPETERGYFDAWTSMGLDREIGVVTADAVRVVQGGRTEGTAPQS